MNEALIRNGFGLDALDIICLETTDSTNTQAKKYAPGRKTPLLIASDEQTAGRGRQGKRFYSPGGTGLYFSILLPFGGKTEHLPLLTPMAAVAARRGILQTAHADTKIKWVNDLYLQDKKVCGILTESCCDLNGQITHILFGIGINMTTSAFPGEIQGIAGCIACEHRELLAGTIARQLLFLYQSNDENWMAEYQAHGYLTGKRVFFEKNARRFEGIAGMPTPGGELPVVLDSGERVLLSSGEVSVKPI